MAQNLMGIPLLFLTGSRKDKKPVESGSLVQLFETPNPMMAGAQFIEATFVLLGALREGYRNRRKSDNCLYPHLAKEETVVDINFISLSRQKCFFGLPIALTPNMLKEHSAFF